MCAVSKKRRLGKGLSDLMGGMEHLEDRSEETAVQEENRTADESEAAKDKEMLLRIEEVHGNPDQPRKHFEPEALQELTDSVRHFGILQPLLVQRDIAQRRQRVSRKFLCWSEITALSRWRKFPSSKMCSARI